MSIVTNIEDLRRIARRKIPRAIYDYVERGSYDEITLNANRAELNAIRLRQREPFLQAGTRSRVILQLDGNTAHRN